MKKVEMKKFGENGRNFKKQREIASYEVMFQIEYNIIEKNIIEKFQEMLYDNNFGQMDIFGDGEKEIAYIKIEKDDKKEFNQIYKECKEICKKYKVKTKKSKK